MTIESTDLLSALDYCKGLMPRRATLPVLSCVLLSTKDGHLRVSATDFDQYAERLVPATGDLEPCCVPMQRLDVVRYTKGIITLERSDEQWLRTSNSRIATLKAAEFPEWPKDKLQKIGVNCTDLAACIERVQWTAAEESEERKALQTVHVIIESNRIETQASTGKILARIVKPAIATAAELVIPRGFVAGFTEALNEDGAVLSIGERFLCVESEKGTYWCKRPEDRYPAVDLILKEERQDVGIIKPSQWIPILKACDTLQMRENDWRPLDLNFTSKAVTVAFTNAKGETHSETLPGQFKSFQSQANLGMLLEVLNAFQDCDVTVSQSIRQLAMRNGELTVIVSRTHYSTPAPK